MEVKGLNELAKEIHQRNVDKGFYDDIFEAYRLNLSEKMMRFIKSASRDQRMLLIVGEISEAQEACRKGKFCKLLLPSAASMMTDEYFDSYFKENVKDTFQDEIADVFIRLMDFIAFDGIDIEAHVKAKLKYNSLRPYKHGKQY